VLCVVCGVVCRVPTPGATGRGEVAIRRLSDLSVVQRFQARTRLLCSLCVLSVFSLCFLCDCVIFVFVFVVVVHVCLVWYVNMNACMCAGGSKCLGEYQKA